MKKPTDKARIFCENFVSLSLKWTTSRAHDTYGYNVCTLYLNRYNGNSEKAARCNGGGYDLAGTALGEMIHHFFRDDLKRLASDIGSNTPWNTRGTFYGLTFWDVKHKKCRKHYKPGFGILLDGGCGFSCMEHILNALGIQLIYKRISAREDMYIFNLTTKKGR
jgi:hypothetical protein